jgi:hypothetical protein
VKRAATLDGVTRAKGAYALAKSTLEARLREQLKEELRKLNAQLDIAIRYAYDDGHSKADILRALGTKDFYTLKNSLERTENVTEEKGINPLDTLYSFDSESGKFTANYVNHGPAEITGYAEFSFRILQDGTKWFMASTPLYTDDYATLNKVVAALDGKQDGYYYEEALDWLNEQI